MQIELVALDDLILDDKNARIHNQKNKDAIKASLARHAQVEPLVVQKSTNMIIGGNGRYEVMKEMGWTECEVVYVDIDNTQATLLSLSLNRTGDTSSFDEMMLPDILKGLQTDGFDLGEIGFDAEDLASLEFDVPKEGNIPDDEIPEPKETTVKKGDLYQLGDHRLLCGDATSKQDVDRLMDGNKADMVFTDPPYGIDASNMTLGTGKKEFHRGEDWDKGRIDFRSILEYADKHIIWGGNYFTDWLPISNDWLCWHKKNDGLSFSEFELAYTNLGKNTRMISHHWGGEKKDHPTQKPIDVITWAMELSESKSILDPFGGSGSTLIACEKTGRRCFMSEIDPHYCQVILDRWSKFTGKKALKIS